MYQKRKEKKNAGFRTTGLVASVRRGRADLIREVGRGREGEVSAAMARQQEASKLSEREGGARVSLAKPSLCLLLGDHGAGVEIARPGPRPARVLWARATRRTDGWGSAVVETGL